ncbi:MAG: helix-turn-helix domain-containing protein [Micromonosporaceae bacterium]|nr:helix-turn-helix domain-containing protein [Micromonosporaceae bacterium]
MSADPHQEAASTSAFAALLRGHRRAKGYTQEEFAARSGVGVRTLRDLERGRARPQRATVDLLATALGLRGAALDEFAATARRTLPARGPVRELVNLPPAPILFGREAALVELDAVLRQAALVTLVGAAGVGKTSLAVAAAHQVAYRHPDGVAGVVVCDESTVDDILAILAAQFGVDRAAGLPARLSGRPALLVLDGVERSPGPAVEALRWLQENTSQLRLLATGREPTGIAGEYAWLVPPLETPPPGATDPVRVGRYPAAALFLDRLRRVRPEEPTAQETAVLADLVRLLGGLPLALELGAARGRTLELGEILDGYRVPDGAATGGTGAEPPPLREALAASYRMLDPGEQAALRRLAQFRNRWTVELAEPVLTTGRAGPGTDPMTLVDRLVGLGLLNIRGTGPMRFRLLAPVRDFAIAAADAAGEVVEDRRRHALAVIGYAERLAPGLLGGTGTADLLDDVAPDLRAAMVTTAADDPVTGLRLARLLPGWWRLRGQDRSGRRWLHRLLDDPRTADADPALRAWAQVGCGELAAEHGDGAAELSTVEDAVRAFTRLRDVPGQLAARTQLSVLYELAGEYATARQHGEAALALATRHGRTRDVLVAQNHLAWHDLRSGDLSAARRRLTTVQRLAAELGEDRPRALAHANLAEVARLEQRYGEAISTGQRAVVLLEALGDHEHRRRVLRIIGLAQVQARRIADAQATLRQLAGGPAKARGGTRRSGRSARVPAGDGDEALVEAHLMLVAGDRTAAAERFASAAEAFAGRVGARDPVEALVGLAAAAGDSKQRARVRAEIDALCARTGISLLDGERALVEG